MLSCPRAGRPRRPCFSSPPGRRRRPPPPEPSFSGSLDVRVAEVEVFVADRDGRPVPQPGGATTSGSSRTASPPRSRGSRAGGSQPLSLAVFVDQSTLDVASRSNALAALRRLFASALRPGDRVLLASWDGSLKIEAEATGEPAVLAAALDRLGARRLPGCGPSRSATPSGGRSSRRLAGRRKAAGRSPSPRPTAALTNLRAYAPRPDGSPGPPSAPSSRRSPSSAACRSARPCSTWAAARRCAPARTSSPPGRAVSAASRRSSASPRSRRRAMRRHAPGPGAADRANAAGIPLFAIALPVGGSASRAPRAPGPRPSQLAAGTGGRAVTDFANPAAFLETWGGTCRRPISLAYAPPPGPQAGEPRIEVTVRGGALVARHRERRRDGEAGRPLLRRPGGAVGGPAGRIRCGRSSRSTRKEKDRRGARRWPSTVSLSPRRASPSSPRSTSTSGT